MGDHFLVSVSNFILRQIQKPFAKYFPDDWDPFNFLPVNIQSNLQNSESPCKHILNHGSVWFRVGTMSYFVDEFETKSCSFGQL